ncbi:MAG TPA: hypothetical protein VMM93_07650 [Vicinamibacterales bacterium]|nr:hypothetical protein [Vicinamibacterales bacterium]
MRLSSYRQILPAVVASLVSGAACATPSTTMDQVAERYVRLVLQVGQHDADYVDAFYGDPAWRPTGEPAPLETLVTEQVALAAEPVLRHAGGEPLVELRRAYLRTQLASVGARLAMLGGTRLTFDEEARALYDTEPPTKTAAEFQAILDELERLLPGPGSLIDRYTAFRNGFVIAADRLDAVFKAAIDGCREKTAAHLAMPEGESFTVEYVTGKTWSGYNWYQGGFKSLIQVNTDLPITIDRAIDLACHEGYPGHHVYNMLLEQHLVRDRGWVEFSVYPLFSPQSLIAEGTANFGIDVAFPGAARTMFERDVLYPLAGLDPAMAERYSDVQSAVERLSYAGNEAARRYLNGEIDRGAAEAYLVRYALMPADRAAQRVRFMDQYRSYVINYNVGQDLVRAYVERNGGTADNTEARWRIFGDLLSSPRLPSGLQ